MTVMSGEVLLTDGDVWTGARTLRLRLARVCQGGRGESPSASFVAGALTRDAAAPQQRNALAPS